MSSRLDSVKFYCDMNVGLLNNVSKTYIGLPKCRKLHNFPRPSIVKYHNLSHYVHLNFMFLFSCQKNCKLISPSSKFTINVSTCHRRGFMETYYSSHKSTQFNNNKSYQHLRTLFPSQNYGVNIVNFIFTYSQPNLRILINVVAA